MQIPYTSRFQRLYELVNFYFLQQLWLQEGKDSFPIGDSDLFNLQNNKIRQGKLIHFETKKFSKANLLKKKKKSARQTRALQQNNLARQTSHNKILRNKVARCNKEI